MKLPARLAVLLAVLAVTACAPRTADTSASGGDEKSGTLRVWLFQEVDNQPKERVVDAVVDRFEKTHEGTEVMVEYIPVETRAQRVKAAFNDPTSAPDVVEYGNTDTAGYVRDGGLADVTGSSPPGTRRRTPTRPPGSPSRSAARSTASRTSSASARCTTAPTSSRNSACACRGHRTSWSPRPEIRAARPELYGLAVGGAYTYGALPFVSAYGGEFATGTGGSYAAALDSAAAARHRGVHLPVRRRQLPGRQVRGDDRQRHDHRVRRGPGGHGDRRGLQPRGRGGGRGQGRVRRRAAPRRIPHEVTVQLDAVQLGDGMLRQVAAGVPEASDAPVFVDETGRRVRRFRRIGMAVGLAGAAFAVVTVATLLSGDSEAPALPVPEQNADRPASQVDSPPLDAESAPPSAPDSGGAAAKAPRKRRPHRAPSTPYRTPPPHPPTRAARCRIRRRRPPGPSPGPVLPLAEPGRPPRHSRPPTPRPTPPPPTTTRPPPPPRSPAAATRAASARTGVPAARPSTPRSPPTPRPRARPLMASRPRHRAATGARDGSRQRRLPLRFLLPALVLVALMAMLMLRGYVHSEILADHRVRPAAASDRVPEDVLTGGPVIDARSGRPTTLSVPDHRLVLTFDDGPDPVWTPKVLDVLKKHDAHAVFFVTGTMASRYPDLVERMVAEGHEIGLHTFNHPDLSYQSKRRIDWELSQNQLAISGAACIAPPCSARRTPPSPRPWTTRPGR
ncbi:hypothetical protein SGLAM104S_08894 [Streptomyces glaucescens]